MDRLGFWGLEVNQGLERLGRFQYPLMDRLGFWGTILPDGRLGCQDFSIR